MLSQDKQLEMLTERIAQYKIALDVPLDRVILDEVVHRAQIHQVLYLCDHALRASRGHECAA